MEIPIQNIYFLLCYAWNKLDVQDIVDVQTIESTKLYDLFAKVLIGGISRLLKMGLDRGYIHIDEETAGIKGKLNLSYSLKRNLLVKAKAYCQFDDLNHNILNNQIIKSTIDRLAEVDELAVELKNQLYDLSRRLNEVERIQLGKSVFRKIQLHGNNSFYDFLHRICELVIENLLPTEEKGHSKFRDFIRDETQMSILFEEFVRNFYRIEQNQYYVYREDIHWDITSGDTSFLQKMQTDISLESNDKKIIIDTKYYREALTEHYEKEKIKSENMRQMYAYLTNLDSTKNINRNCIGILLYPTVTKNLDISLITHGHKISFKTINLNQEWQNIHKDLLSIIDL